MYIIIEVRAYLQEVIANYKLFYKSHKYIHQKNVDIFSGNKMKLNFVLILRYYWSEKRSLIILKGTSYLKNH